MTDHTIYVALDTMVYLHYRSVDQLDLAKTLSAAAITILVPRITVQELDTHKNTHTNSKIRERARKRLVALLQWIDAGEVGPGVGVTFLAPRPDIDFRAHGLNAQWNDDQLLAALIQFREQHAGSRVVLLTQDTGLLLSAKHLGIEAVSVGDEDRLPPDADPIAKENQELKNELLRLKTAQPALVLRLKGMADDEDHVTFELSIPVQGSSLDKDAFLADMRRKLPEKHPPPAPNKTAGMSFATLALANSFGEVIPQREYVRYNRDRESYFKNLSLYMDRLAAYRTQPDRTLLLEIEMRNTGSVPAEDIDLALHFPDGFDLYSEADLPVEPQVPQPPAPPQTDLQNRMAGLTAHMSSAAYLPRFGGIAAPPDPFSLTKSNSYDLADHVQRLKHGCSYEIRRLYLVYPAYEAAKSFHIEYRLAAANLHQPACGELHIVVEKQ